MFFSESDTRSKFIDQKLKNDGWQENSIIREYYFTDWRKLLWNARWKRKFADYILSYKWIKLAIIEAKKLDLEATEWLEQVKEYAKILNLRFVFSTNWKKIYQFDMQTGFWSFVENYPNPEKLYEMVFEAENEVREILLKESFYLTDKKPRYYQEIAIQKTIEKIAENQKRILLTLATWTGKTVIAFQIIYKLFQARWSLDGIGKRRPRILFLADRNVLVNQAMNTFNPFEKDIIKINSEEIRKRNGKVPTNASIFFWIYQALTGWNYWEDTENDNFSSEEYFRQYDKNFFDLIVIDECHRGWAREDGNWAEILKYFESAVQIGLTATPKRADNVDTYKYFWNPIYEYSLKNGIDDGFLTPFKIKRIQLNTDELVLNSSDKIISWEVKKQVFGVNDMDRTIVIDERTELVAQTILQQINKMDKTIIFCVDQDHALRMRDAINKYKTVKDADYCVRVTSNEWEIWKIFLEKFQNNSKDIPTILTSSQMLTTWVDALNVRNIVLDRNIWSIVEYKQIIGRGTRVFDGKDFFTVYDFRWATTKFVDEIWDWLPEEDFEKEEKEKELQKQEKFENILPKDEEIKEKNEKIFVKLADNREVKIINIETRYLDPTTGKHLSSEDFIKKILGELPKLYQNEHDLRLAWANPETREKFLKNLEYIWLDAEQIENLKKIFEAEKSDIFDILAYISYGNEIKNRTERSKIAKSILEKYKNPKAKDFLQFLLELYEREWIMNFKKDGLSSKIELFNRWLAREIAAEFGWVQELKQAYYDLQKGIYEVEV